MFDRRRLSTIPVLAVTLLSLAACGRSDEERAAALCNEWGWDYDQTEQQNIDAYDKVWATLDSDGTVDLEGMARDACPGHFQEYDTATQEQLDELRHQYGQDDSGSSASDVSGSNNGGDSSVADFLVSRGVSDSMVRQLGSMADETGYGLSPGTPLPFEQAQSFAAVMVGNCDDVASGEKAWSGLVNEDVETGAPLAAAQEMYGFVRTSFCPQVR